MAKDHIKLEGGPLDGLAFQAVEWPPRPILTWEQVQEGCVVHDRKVSEAGYYKLRSHSQRPEPYPDDVNVFRGGLYIWIPNEMPPPYDGQHRRDFRWN